MPAGISFAGVIEAIARVLKVIFGMDKPGTVEVDIVQPMPGTKLSDEQIRHDLGVGSEDTPSEVE